MLDLINNLTFRLLLCAVIAYLAWRQDDVIGLIFSSLVFGLALSGPILELIINLSAILKQSVYSNSNGRLYVFEDRAIDIHADENNECWISIAEARKVIKGFPKDAVIVKLYPHDLIIDKKRKFLRIRAVALVNYLQSSSNITAMKFKLWIEREVIFPKSS